MFIAMFTFLPVSVYVVLEMLLLLYYKPYILHLKLLKLAQTR